MMLGSGTGSSITAQAVFVNEISTGSVSVSVTFSPNGTQFTTVNGSNTVVGKWVLPELTADQWEIRTTLVSGTTPSGTLNTWQPVSVNRTWGLSVSVPGVTAECILTFEFRKVGATDPEVTVSGNILSAEVLDIFGP